jgi:hypothetical protein
MNTTPKPVPYPADTRAKGWRFELDLEQIHQSDTWAIAAPEERPWLYMLWTTAWQQTPCGSMPSDPKLICARLGMSPKMFAKCADTILRGWWLAEDGRLYHDTLVTRVEEMVARKNGERNRKAEWRAKKEAEEKLAAANLKQQKPEFVPPLSHGTDVGQTWDGHGTDDTGTGTGTGLCTGRLSTHSASVRDFGVGQICKAMKRAGVSDVNPGNQTLKALVEAGAQVNEFEGAAAKAASEGKGFAYALGIVKREREQAAVMAGRLHRGEMPKAETAYQRSMRERVEEIAPDIARQDPASAVQAVDFFRTIDITTPTNMLAIGAMQ